MAKKARKKVAAKARKPARSVAKKAAKKAAKGKRAVTKPRRKAAPLKAAKPAAKKPAVSKPVASMSAAAQLAAGQQPPPKRESFLRKVEDAVEAVFDTLSDAEKLHRKLEPNIDPDQE